MASLARGAIEQFCAFVVHSKAFECPVDGRPCTCNGRPPAMCCQSVAEIAICTSSKQSPPLLTSVLFRIQNADRRCRHHRAHGFDVVHAANCEATSSSIVGRYQHVSLRIPRARSDSHATAAMHSGAGPRWAQDGAHDQLSSRVLIRTIDRARDAAHVTRAASMSCLQRSATAVQPCRRRASPSAAIVCVSVSPSSGIRSYQRRRYAWILNRTR